MLGAIMVKKELKTTLEREKGIYQTDFMRTHITLLVTLE
jgi:hypothetical protein